MSLLVQMGAKMPPDEVRKVRAPPAADRASTFTICRSCPCQATQATLQATWDLLRDAGLAEMPQGCSVRVDVRANGHKGGWV